MSQGKNCLEGTQCQNCGVVCKRRIPKLLFLLEHLQSFHQTPPIIRALLTFGPLAETDIKQSREALKSWECVRV